MKSSLTATQAPGDAPDTRRPGEYRPPYLAAALAALAVWLLYLATLAPTTWFWDTSEYITVAHILGIPHAPGNPLFVVLAHAWELLLAPTGLSVATRINLLSATMGALAHGLWFLVAHRILSFGSDHRGFRLAGAAAATLISATMFTVWNQSNVNEKVYTVSFLTIALVSWLVFRWRDRGGDPRLLVLIAYLLALSAGNHLMALLAVPALLLFVMLAGRRALPGRRVGGAVVVAVALGLSVQIFLPIRAGLDPIINETDPSCDSFAAAVTSVYTAGNAGCEALSSSLQREQYGKPSVLERQAPFGAQLANYFQYFDWQWARSVSGEVSYLAPARLPITLLFLGLGVFGALGHRRRDRSSFLYVAALFATLSVALVFYLNFEYGFTQVQALGLPFDLSEVRDRDYFFLIGFSVWGVWAGIGLATLWQRLAERRGYALTAPVLAIALIPLALNWSWASRADDYSARDWAYNLLQSVEPYGVLFTNGDNDTFPLWYLQEVEGIRQDVTVVVSTYLRTPWYVKQIRELTTPCPPGVSAADDPTRILCQRAYRGDQGLALYAAGERTPPEDSIIQLTDAQIELMASRAFAAPRDLLLNAGNLQTAIPEGTVLAPEDTFISSILVSTLGRRPIHFTFNPALDTLGLDPFLVRHGLAFKLHNGPVRPDAQRGLLALPRETAGATGPYIDLPVTDTLLDEVFVHRGGIPDEWDHWADTGSRSTIPRWYAYTHYAAAQAHALLGREAEAERHLQRADQWMDLTGE